MRRHVAPLVLLTLISVSVAAQRRPDATLATGQRISIATSVEPTEASPGGDVVLRLRVTPRRGHRVFAPGASDFTPMTAMLSPAKGLELRKAKFPSAGKERNPGNMKEVPLYKSEFTIEYAATIDEKVKPGTTIRVTGTVIYQTCDNRVVYPRQLIPVTMTVQVKEP
jgi:hypothetical protein